MKFRFPILIVFIALMAPLAYAEKGAPADKWNGDRAMNDIGIQLSFGRRALDTLGHEKTVQYIEGQLANTKLASVKGQQWIDTGDTSEGQNLLSTGSNQPHHALVNIVARFFPDNPRRIIIGTHYDSIGRAYADKKHPDAPMPGANNSASGVALLRETARVLSKASPPSVGVDLVFFDGEEGPKSLGAGDRNWRALGSPWFAQHLSDFYPDAKPESAVLFDMVCYKNMELKPELSSLASAKDEVEKFWKIGGAIGPAVFKEEPYPYAIEDDHNALAAAGIPSFLVIGFKYDPWFNTTEDTIDKCSQANLEAVGRTLLRYIYAL